MFPEPFFSSDNQWQRNCFLIKINLPPTIFSNYNNFSLEFDIFTDHVNTNIIVKDFFLLPLISSYFAFIHESIIQFLLNLKVGLKEKYFQPC